MKPNEKSNPQQRCVVRQTIVNDPVRQICSSTNWRVTAWSEIAKTNEHVTQRSGQFVESYHQICINTPLDSSVPQHFMWLLLNSVRSLVQFQCCGVAQICACLRWHIFLAKIAQKNSAWLIILHPRTIFGRKFPGDSLQNPSALQRQQHPLLTGHTPHFNATNRVGTFHTETSFTEAGSQIEPQVAPTKQLQQRCAGDTSQIPP